MDPSHVSIDGETEDALAIVGFSAKLSQDATSSNQFWRMLSQGRSARTEVPNDRFNIDSFYHPDANRPDAIPTRHGHFLSESLAAFDTSFFSIQPTEALSMDPQQRLMLETSYRALENAGLSLEAVAGSKTGVFVGVNSHDYETLLLRDPDQPAKYIGTGIGISLLANRVSWFFDLKGPSLSIDTACSSSMVGFHLACESLKRGETDMCLVGGANLVFAPDLLVHLSSMGFLNPDGICYTFDSRGVGYSKGEGVAVVAIKRLKDALRDDDCIRAVIRASTTNQDGRTPGLTTPSQQAQTENIRNAYRSAGLNLERTAHFEAHGTGTQVGDQIETSAINDAFRRGKDNPLYIGALKPNIGHLESASGIAGIVKAVLMLEHGLIPPNIWFEKLNPSIPADEWNFKFPLALMPWPKPGLRRISLNSFGYGGANAHVILDDALHYLDGCSLTGHHNTNADPAHTIQSEAAECDGWEVVDGVVADKVPPKIMVWSTFDEAGIQRLVDQYQTDFDAIELAARLDSKRGLSQLAYTLSHRRSALPWKSYMLADSLEDIRLNMCSEISKPLRSSSIPTLLFVFTGQGAQWCAMGRELIHYPVYHASLKRFEQALQDLGCHWSLIDELLKAEEISSIHMPDFSQPLSTAVQLALVDLISSWDILPKAVVGHSSGEIAAAYCAGGLDFESAVKVSYYRGVLTSRLIENRQFKGSMASIALSEDEIAPYLAKTMQDTGEGQISVGCVNSPRNVTVTGDSCCIDTINSIMNTEGIFARKIGVSVAYHSHHMNPIASEYHEKLGILTSGSGTVPKDSRMFSSVTGTEIAIGDLLDPGYWVANMVSKVKFSEALIQSLAVTTALRVPGGKTGVVEIGAHAALQRPIKDTTEFAKESDNIFYECLLWRNKSAFNSCLGTVARLWCRGYPVDLIKANSVTAESCSPVVDLPQYPFNHTQQFWQESRISKNHRFRQHKRHELLGVRSSDWNQSEPKWRNRLRFSELPWMQDYKCNDTVLFPAGGMLVLAIEGLRQLITPPLKVNGWFLRHVRFLKGLLVSDDPDGDEIQFHLAPTRYEGSIPVECNFSLYSWSNNDWQRVCDGIVAADISNSRYLENLEASRTFRIESNQCCEAIDSTQYYENIASFGYQFGRAFRNVQSLKYNDDHIATAKIALGNEYDSAVPSDQRSIIHPVDLEGVIQLGTAAVSQGSWTNVPLYLPTRLKQLWLTNDLQDSGPQRIDALGKMTFKGYREAEFSFLACNGNGNTILAVDGFRETAISKANLEESQKSINSLCYHLEWQPELNLLSESQIETIINQKVTNAGRSTATRADDQEEIYLYYLVEAIKGPKDPIPVQPSELSAWIGKWIEESLNQGHTLHSPTKPIESNGHVSMNGSTHVGKDTKHLSNNIVVDLLSRSPSCLEVRIGKTATPINIPSNSDSSCRRVFQLGYEMAAAYLDMITHKTPGLQILEINGGDGSSTEATTRALTSRYGIERTPPFAQYTFTDSSTSACDSVAARLSTMKAPLVFSRLDIEEDLEQQGFLPAKYDIILCFSTLQNVSDLQTTLQRVRQLLAPGGKLVLFEPRCSQAGQTHVVYNIVETKKLETKRQLRSIDLFSAAAWKQKLIASGFSAPQIYRTRQSEESTQQGSLIVTTAEDPSCEDTTAVSGPADCFIVANPESIKQQETARAIVTSRNIPKGRIISMGQLETENLTNTHLIFLCELDEPLLSDVNAGNWEILSKTLGFATTIIWATQGCGDKAVRPEMGIVTGLGRNVSSENWNIKFVELSLECETSAVKSAQHILSVLDSTLVDGQKQADTEIMEVNGLLHIPRIFGSPDLNEMFHRKLTPQPAEQMQLGSVQSPVKLTVGAAGDLGSLQYEDDWKHDKPLAVDEVEVRVATVGVCFRDVLVAMGQVPGDTLGFECAGTVSRAGEQSGFFKDQRVCCFTTNGAYGTFARTHASAVAAIPSTMSFIDAASIPTAFCTAYFGLVTLGRLEEGQSVLIHSAAGGVGQAALQIARHLKAEIFATVGSGEKKQLLKAHYNIPEDHIFSSRDTAFAQQLKQKVGGPDVVLNSLGGEGLQESWTSIASMGRFIELGKVDLNSSSGISMEPFTRNATFTSLDLASMFNQNKPAFATVMREVMNHFIDQENPFRMPHPIRVFQANEVKEAFKYLQERPKGGKVVVEMKSNAVVPIVPSLKPTYQFAPDATYVIAGGLGGLGRCLTEWMVDRGARHFLMLSRSGASSPAVLEFVQRMNAMGVEIQTPRCDITDANRVAFVLEDCKRTMPPITGCIQSSVMIKSNLFHNMSHSDWTAVLTPKVQGSWNLHKHLPRDLSFFVLLSSVSSITGSRSQANYAAATTYQDALARHRVSQGQKAISLDLGSIMGVGMVAESNLNETLKREGFQGLRKADLLALMDWACDPSQPLRQDAPWTSQVITGLGYAEKLPPEHLQDIYWARKPLFSHLRHISFLKSRKGDGTPQSSKDALDLASRVKAASDDNAATDMVLEALVEKLARALSTPKDDIDPSKPIHAFGIDSLFGVEVKYWFHKEIGAEVTMFDIMGAKSLYGLADLASRRSGARNA